VAFEREDQQSARRSSNHECSLVQGLSTAHSHKIFLIGTGESLDMDWKDPGGLLDGPNPEFCCNMMGHHHHPRPFAAQILLFESSRPQFFKPQQASRKLFGILEFSRAPTQECR
jgi:hypothetical protein